MFGRAYHRSTGTFSFDQKNHLLKQYTAIPAKNRRLLFYLFDTIKRYKSICGVNAYVKRDRQSVKALGALIGDAFERSTIKRAAKNPDDAESKAVLNKYLKHLRFAGKDIAYGPMEMAKLKSYVLESCNRYGPCSSFLTLSFSEPNNTRGLRATFSTIDNAKFPATFHDGCEFGSTPGEFMANIRAASCRASSGEIPAANQDLTELRRANMVKNNPVAFVSESKAMIYDVLALLLGISPEDVFGETEGDSRRTTRYFKVNKGVNGHCQAILGVVEDHAKGTLHYHLLFFGGLSPYLLQRFCRMETVCKQIASVLDHMYRSHIPAEEHFPYLLMDAVHKSADPALQVRNLGTPCIPPLLLDERWKFSSGSHRTGGGANCPTCTGVCQFTNVAMIKQTDHQAGQQNCHHHMFTCHHGFLGLTGCRLCMPCGLCATTHPVLLQEDSQAVLAETALLVAAHTGTPIPDRHPTPATFVVHEDSPHVLAWQEFEPFSPAGSDDVPDGAVAGPDGAIPVACWRSTAQEGKCTAFQFSAIDPIPDKPGDSRYDTLDIVATPSQGNEVVVWETARPELAPSQWENAAGLFAGATTKPNAVRERVRIVFSKMLPDGNATFDSNSPFWSWLSHLQMDKLKELYQRLERSIRTANGNIATYNHVASFCTGSHNNFQLLGSLEQAKGAMFYVCPYIGKSKFPLQQSLALLNKTLEHIEKYPSRAKDASTTKRTAQYILQRTLNRMMLQMELSDFQIVADLLQLPSLIRTDTFAFVDPLASMAYQTLVQFNEDSLNAYEKMLNTMNGPGDVENMALDDQFVDYDIESDDDASSGNSMQAPPSYNKADLLRTLGRVEVMSYSETTQTGQHKNYRELVPVVAFYANRGAGLKNMNRIEYACLVKVEAMAADKPSGHGEAGRKTVDRLSFGDGFRPGVHYTQILKAKQGTPVVTVKGPRHPGDCPHGARQEAKNTWTADADAYAQYYLTLYRAEVEQYDSSHSNKYQYGWDDLQAWIATQKESPNILSKFRLMAMHLRMRGFNTKFNNKVMLSKYRGRNRKLWTSAQQSANKAAYGKGKQSDHLLDEYDFRAQHLSIAPRTLATMKKQCEYDKAQTLAYIQTRGPDCRSRRITSGAVFTALNVTELQMIAVNIKDGPTEQQRLLLQQAMALRTKHAKKAPLNSQAPQLQLNGEQAQVLQVYAKYFENPLNPETKPPAIVLVHGKAGTGKSQVIKAVVKLGATMNAHSLRTAFNSINAIAINGHTTFSFTSLDVKIHSEKSDTLSRPNYDRIKRQLEGVVLLILDEISTQAPWHLARLSNVCQQVKNVFTEPFGGIPILLVGDLKQLPPVLAGSSLTQALFDIIAVGKGHKSVSRQGKGKKKLAEPTIALPAVDKGIKLAKHKYNELHPIRVGAELLTRARWMELVKSERTDDTGHDQVLQKIYDKNLITTLDMQRYQLLSEDDFARPNSPWLQASIICSTNREQYTLTHHAAKRFAAARGQVVYRWMTSYSNWEGCPGEDAPDVFDDPCFYEYFVEGADGFITKKLNSDLCLVNATPVQYHSLCIEDKDDLANIQATLLHAIPGDIITLSVPPVTVNVELFVHGKDREMFDDYQREFLISKSICGIDRVVIPIGPGSSKVTERVVVHGGANFGCSKIRITQIFPLELAFAITVNKSQGRTIGYVILALSYNPAQGCNMGLQEIYVALSRVRVTGNIRLLLKGTTPAQKRFSLAYINTIRPDITVDCFFAGFRNDGNKPWTELEWNESDAYASFVEASTCLPPPSVPTDNKAHDLQDLFLQ